MSIALEILKELWDMELNYKGIRVNIFGIPRFKRYSTSSLKTTINRIKNRGLIRKELAGLVLSKHGRAYVRRKYDSLISFSKPKNLSKDKNLLVMFDVPVERKGERDWLRWHLKKFGYILIQKSVWVGPSPLPEEFKDYLKKIKLDTCIKTFKLSKNYQEN